VKDDSSLIEATRAGDTEAFGQLVLKYQDRLHHSVAGVIGSHDEALDVVQEAFVQAFTKLDSFRGGSAFYTWLYRIAWNTAITHRRRKRPTISMDRLREDSGDELIDQAASPQEEVGRQERAVLVQQAMSRVAEEFRAVLVLREIDGCCYETIAEILDLPIGTVRSRLHRARMMLREELKHVLH